ncbi:hypothetical protein FJTKL_04789 [Diaporthe vaccinii]|uniref:Uncharacterized protein n=1 Tax=Diaporthe vaccinii TaxID=105482 RepID=A0ABR4DSP4_9PEZI
MPSSSSKDPLLGRDSGDSEETMRSPKGVVDFPIRRETGPYRVLVFTLVGALVGSLIWTMALGAVSKNWTSTSEQHSSHDKDAHDCDHHEKHWDGPTDPDGYPFPLSAHNNPLVNQSIPLTQPPIQPGEVPTTNGPNCGDSVEVAKARGCKYDWTVNSWVPPMCVSDELSDAMVKSREWFVYEDEERTRRVPIEDILTGTYENLWVDWGYHVTHCEFAFKKLAVVARTPGMAYVGQAINEYHTNHCIEEVLANRTFAPLSFQDTYLHRGWASCYRKE